MEISILTSRSVFLCTNLPHFQSLFCLQPMSFYTSPFSFSYLMNSGLPWFSLAATDCMSFWSLPSPCHGRPPF